MAFRSLRHTLAAMLVLLFLATGAAAAVQVRVMPAVSSGVVGSNVTVTVEADSVTSLGGFQFGFTYSTSDLQVVSSAVNPAFDQIVAQNTGAGTGSGMFAATVFNNASVSGTPVTLATIDFKILTPVSGTINLGNVVLGQVGGAEIPSAAVSGSITGFNAYTVTYNANGGSGSAPSDPNSYLSGAAVTVLANTFTRSGYSFAGWNTAANGSGTSQAAASTFSMGSANVTLYAQWTAIPTYTVTYNGNGNSGGTAPVDGSSPYVSGSNVTVLGSGTLIKAGFTFNGWNTLAGGTGTAYTAAGTITAITANTTLYAQWTALPTYTVSYNANGGSGTAPVDPNSYLSGATVTVLANTFTRSGYSFAGWNTAANGSGTSQAAASTFSMGSANVTLYAQWTALPTYTVSYNANGGSGTAPVDPNSYLSGATVTVLANTFTRSGYSFAGWNTAANGSGTSQAAASTFSMGSANVTLYAQWTALPTYTVSYNANGGSGTAPVDPNSYLSGATVTVLANTFTRSGYSFAGWNTAANGSGTSQAAASTFSMGSANVTLYAQWTALPTYTVSYNANGGSGTAPVDPNSYLSGATVTVLANTFTRSGYSFAGWNTAANGSGTSQAAASTFSMGSANVTLYAQWTALPTYTVSYNANGGSGTAPVDPNSYLSGATVTVLANTFTRSGYSFAGWNTAANGSGTSQAAASTFSMGSANVTLYAQWTAIPTYTVTYNGNGNSGGNAPVDGSSPYVSGSNVTVLGSGTLVKAGFTFNGWNTIAGGTGTAYAAAGTITAITANTTLYAQWTALPTYTVTFISGGNGTLTGTTSQTVVEGGNTTSVTAIPAGGYHFVNWTEGATVVAVTAALSISNVTAAHSYTANFVANPVNGVCGSSNGGTFRVVPVINLCSPAAAATVTGSGPWNWICNGSNGGTPVNCSANIDITGPTLTVSTLANGAITNNATLNVSGTVSDSGGVAGLTINNAVITVTNGSFSYPVTLQAGTNTITVIAVDTPGNSTTDTRTVTLDTEAPLLTISAPADNSKTAQPFAAITGTINETSTVTVTVNSGSLQNASITGNAFSATVNLAVGLNSINITATDLAANTSSVVRSVTYDNTNPTLAITSPNQDITTPLNSITISGTVSDAITSVTVAISFNNQSYSPAVVDGTFSQLLAIPAEGTYTVTATATDQAGNSSSVSRNIIYAVPANGFCGTSNGGSFNVAPSAFLCSAGTASEVIGSGPWSWSCSGSNGGTDASCSANRLLNAQSISFGVPPSLTYGGADGTVSASATSGLTVTFGSLTPDVCSVTGSTVTPLTAGTCTIAANQAGNGNYSAASQVTQNITVAQAGQTIAFGVAPSLGFGGAAGNVSAIATSELGVTFSSLTGGVCTVSGNTVTPVAAGICTIAANQAGNGNYSAAPQVTQNISVAQAGQTITFGAAPSLSLGGAAGTLTASATSGLGVTFNSLTSGVCTVNGSTVTPLTAGTCTIAANQAGNGNYSAAPQVTQNITVLYVDNIAPVISSFIMPATTAGFPAAISDLTVTDDVGVTGYLLSGSATAPLATSPAWVATKPATYTFPHWGNNMLYAFAKDAVGHVSASKSAKVRIGPVDGIIVPSAEDLNPALVDALKSLNFALNIETPTETELLHGDVAPLVEGIPHPDGKIDLGDVIVILRRVVGL